METKKLIPSGEYKVTVLAGANGSGKTKLIKKFAMEYSYHVYTERWHNGINRYNDILQCCKVYNHVVIDNIELYIDSDTQQNILSDIFKINPDISIVCSTHSPFIIADGWINKVIQIEDL